MIIKDKAYYESFNQNLEYLQGRVNYHIEQANSWKDIYRITKDKRGYGLLNKFARHMNEVHVIKGTKIGMKALNRCEEEIVCLEKYISNKEGSA